MKLLPPLAIFAFLVILPFTAQAKESGDQYPNGAETFMAGALPPPGNYFLNYSGYYSGTLQDSQSNDINAVKVNALFDALRVVHVSEVSILGGNYVAHAILPLVAQNIETFGIDNKARGVGDITINPFAIAWHWTHFHMVTGLDINLPTGNYDNAKPLESTGTNYFTLEPLLGVTYRNAQGWELSTKLMYSLHGENDDTNYTSGDEFHMDYGVNKHYGSWAFGIGGYYLKQLENDEINGIELNHSKGEVLAIGPQVKFDYRGISFISKWQKEIESENRFEGSTFYLKIITRL